MDITELVIENFLSFKERQTIVIERLNNRPRAVVVGENGCGKTNLVRALQFIINNCEKREVKSNNQWNKNKPCLVAVKLCLSGEDLQLWQAFVRLAISYGPFPEIFNPFSALTSKLDIVYRTFGFKSEGTSDIIHRFIGNEDDAPDALIDEAGLSINNLAELRTHFTTQEEWEDYHKISCLTGNVHSVESVIAAILRRRMVFVCESRGLMVSTLLTENTYDLSVVAKKLFEYKNGDDAQQVKLGELKAAFHRFFPKLTPDIIFSPQKDENEKRGERLLKGYPVIIYRNENDSEVNHVSQSSAGMNDVLMLLAAIFIGEFSVIVLDEISRSLHSTLKHILSRTLQHSKLCVIAVTHDAELVSEATARNVIRFHKDNKRGTYQLPQIVEANDARDIDKTNFWKFVCDPLRLPVFFARGILFVEGESEVRFFNALTNLILKQKIVVPGVELQSFHFLWDVIPLGGAGSSKFAFKLMNDWKHLPHMFLLDWDNFVLSSKKEEMGENQPKKPRRLEWDQIDWSTRKNNALYNHGPACEMIKSDTKPDTWKRLHNAYASKFERIWVWPMDVFDIEGVCGLKKKQLSVKPFADLQDHIEGMLNGLVTVGRADALVAFINRLVNLHNNDE